MSPPWIVNKEGARRAWGDRMIWPVVLCGGSGTRLWPASRADRPKQFLPLVAEQSSFQQTLLRAADLEDLAQVIVVTGPALADLVVEQSGLVGVETTVLIEPEARDSAPAIAAAAAYVQKHDPDGIVLMLAADHHIEPAEVFIAATYQAVAAARDGYIVTFGLPARYPATGFGYIRPGEPLSATVRRVDAFVEKPDLETARRYVEEALLWNSGNFAFLASNLMEELDAFAPTISAGAKAAVDQSTSHDGRIHLDPAGFATTDKTSIDFAVMERTNRAAVVTAEFDWSDLGTWSSIWEASRRDGEGNATHGDVSLIDTNNVLARSNGPFVGVIGASDLVVVAETDAVLVCRLDKDQAVKSMVETLQAAGRSISRRHATTRRGTSTHQTLARVGNGAAELVTVAGGGRHVLEAGLVVVLSGDIDLAGETLSQGQSHAACGGEIVTAIDEAASLLVCRWDRQD